MFDKSMTFDAYLEKEVKNDYQGCRGPILKVYVSFWLMITTLTFFENLQ